MNPLPACVLYSEDEELKERVCGALHSVAKVHWVCLPERLDLQLHQTGPTLLLLDLQSRDAREFLDPSGAARRRAIVIALGAPRSDPMLDAETAGVFSTEDRHFESHRFQRTVAQALDHLRLMVENQLVRQENARLACGGAPSRGPRHERGAIVAPVRHLHRAFRHFNNLRALLEGIVEGVASAAMVSRVGIFAWNRSQGAYRLQAGLRCLEETRDLEYGKTSPFAQWMEVHAHLVSRSNLEHVQDPEERLLLKQNLDALGAEVVIPLQARSQLMGWLFVGHHATGLPFDYSNLEELMTVAEYISTNLENAVLYEEVAIQKRLMESLLHSMTSGIVAVGPDGTVQWFNHAARRLLNVSPEEALNCPVNGLGSRVADAFLRTLKDKKPHQPQEWIDPLTRRRLSLRMCYLADKDVGMGAMAMIEDRTGEQMLLEKQDELERTAFWSELAAAMSHQIRNPLVAIRAFAELLTERYDDPDFRKRSQELIPQEVERLNSTIELINSFAHPPALVMEPLDLRTAFQKAIETARAQHASRKFEIKVSVRDRLPPVKGDGNALARALAHLLANAIEATEDSRNPDIAIQAQSCNDPAGGVEIVVQDHGRGIPANIQDKVFSPFCTTKTAGMGLGLPIVRRTVLDHNGRVSIESGAKGTRVTIVLPCDPVVELSRPRKKELREYPGQVFFPFLRHLEHRYQAGTSPCSARGIGP